VLLELLLLPQEMLKTQQTPNEEAHVPEAVPTTLTPSSHRIQQALILTLAPTHSARQTQMSAS
jgi:hypothetical protein